MRYTIIGLVGLLLISVALLLFWEPNPPTPVPPHTPRPLPSTRPHVPNEHGLYEIIFPNSLMLGATANEYIADILADPRIEGQFLNIIQTESGNVLITYTAEMLESERNAFYELGNLDTNDDAPSIKRVIQENELLTEITILVDEWMYLHDYSQPTRYTANLLVATWAGNYQILSGVQPDDWHVTITVKCYDTNNLISRNEFPSDDMFEISW